MRDGAPSELVAGVARYWSTVDVWRGGELLAEDIPMLSGSTSKSVTDGALTETASIDVARFADGVDWAPQSPLDPLAPAGQRLVVKTIMADVFGVEYETQVGVFRLEVTDEKDDGVLQVDGVGVLADIADGRLTAPFAPRSSGTLQSEARRLVPPGWGIEFDGALVDRPCPQSLEWSDDRLGALAMIVSAFPARLRVDASGQLRVLPPLGDVPVDTDWTLTDGERVSPDAIATVVKAPRRWTRDGIFNTVVVRGAATDDPAKPAVQGVAQKLAGPYAADWGGFGVIPTFPTNPLMTTRAQMTAAAQAMLADALRPARRVVVECASDPRIDVDDSVTVRRGEKDGAWEVNTRGFVVGYTLPLTSEGTMQIEVGIP